MPLTMRCYLRRFGIPRIGASLFPALHPRCVHRHASGAAQDGFGVLPALNHISKLSAGRSDSCAILVWLRATGPRSTIYQSRAREVTIRTQSGRIRSASLAAPAINQSGRGSCSVFIALLYERPPYSESGVYLRAAVCVEHPHAICSYSGRFPARGGMRYCCGVPDSALCIPNSASPFPAQRIISSLSLSLIASR